MSKIEQVFKTTDGYCHSTLERAEIHQKHLDNLKILVMDILHSNFSNVITQIFTKWIRNVFG